MPKVQTNQQLQQQMNGHYYLCARNLSTQQRFSLDMDKSEKHIHSGFFLLFSVVRSVVFLKLQTRTTTTAAAKKNPWKTMGALGFYCAYNTFCTCGHFMTISTYRLCNLWYIPASIPSSYRPRHCATQTPWLRARDVFCGRFFVCATFRFFYFSMMAMLLSPNELACVAAGQVTFSTITFYEYCL